MQPFFEARAKYLPSELKAILEIENTDFISEEIFPVPTSYINIVVLSISDSPWAAVANPSSSYASPIVPSEVRWKAELGLYGGT